MVITVRYLKMPRQKPLEEMTNVCVRAPLSLVTELRTKGTNLSEITVSYWKSLSSSPIDEHFQTVQSKISEYIQIDPSIPRQYSLDDLATERILMFKLALDGIDATASDISAAMVAAERVRA